MPWESRTVMNQREQFVEEAAESRNFSDLCRRYGISRKTGYKWVQRAQAGAPLEDQSRRPGHPFGQTPAEVEEKILAVRSDNPAWGGLKIKAELERRGETGIPSARTCGAILKRPVADRLQRRLSAGGFQSVFPIGHLGRPLPVLYQNRTKTCRKRHKRDIFERISGVWIAGFSPL